jgi:hypothetical protein
MESGEAVGFSCLPGFAEPPKTGSPATLTE